MDKSRHQIAADLPTKPTSLLSKWDFEFKYQQSLIKVDNKMREFYNKRERK